MPRRRSASDGSITGVATGNLGTGTALDDTQVYSVDALTAADHPDDVAESLPPAPVAVAGPPDAAAAPSEARSMAAHQPPPAPSAPVEPNAMPIAPATPVAPDTRPRPRRGPTHGYPVGILAAAAIVLVVIAAALTLRDGGLVGGAGPGVFSGPQSFPPPPSFGVVATPAPKPAPAGHGHGHGHGPH